MVDEYFCICALKANGERVQHNESRFQKQVHINTVHVLVKQVRTLWK